MRRVVVIVIATVGISALLLTATSVAQSSPAEQAIRAQIAKYDKPENTEPLATKDAVVWSGAYSKPQFIGRAPNPTELLAAPGRKNVVNKTHVERIVIATGGDMAYEYSTFTLAFDDNTGHSDRSGALLRVWQRSGSEWQIAAEFRRPYGRVVPVEQGR